MNPLQIINNIKKRGLASPWLAKFDLPFLILLLLTVNYRYSFKLIIIFIAYALRPNFQFLNNKINFFFLGMIAIGLINFLISGNYQWNHFTSFFSGTLIWLGCILIFHQIHLSVQQSTSDKLLNSIKVIVALNFLVSVINITNIAIIVDAINPYTTFTPPPYGIMSGDLVGGVFGKMHLANTCISALFFVLFLKKESYLFALLALLTLLLTSSNIASILIVIGLIYLLILGKGKKIKYFSLSFITIIGVFYASINTLNFYSTIGFISPKTEKHFFDHKVDEILNKKEDNKLALIDSIKGQWEQEREIRNIPPKKNVPVEKEKIIGIGIKLKNIKDEKTTEHLLQSWDYNDNQKKIMDSIVADSNSTLNIFDINKTPGALISYQQTKNLLLSSPKYFLLGAGINEFSSRLAFVNSKLVDDSRLFAYLPKYENQLFTDNHKALFEFLMFAGEETHSIIHLPFSGYNQLLGEYGILGLLLFIFIYLGFFFFRWSKLTYGRLLIILIIPLFAFEYWFERFSVMVIFEMLLLLDLKEHSEKQIIKRNEY